MQSDRQMCRPYGWAGIRCIAEIHGVLILGSCGAAAGPDRVETQKECASGGASLSVRRARDKVGLAISADRARNRPFLGPHCFHQNPGSENLDHSLEVIGEHVEAHLRTDLFQSRREEMRAAHP